MPSVLANRPSVATRTPLAETQRIVSILEALWVLGGVDVPKAKRHAWARVVAQIQASNGRLD
jgi:hypothetical protein